MEYLPPPCILCTHFVLMMSFWAWMLLSAVVLLAQLCGLFILPWMNTCPNTTWGACSCVGEHRPPVPAQGQDACMPRRMFISSPVDGAEQHGCTYSNIEMLHLFCILTHTDRDFCLHGSVTCYKGFVSYQGCFVCFLVLLGFGKFPIQVIVNVFTE